MEHYAALSHLTSAPPNKRVSKVPVSSRNHELIASYFLGNKAENEDILQTLFSGALQDHCEARRKYFPDDPKFITEHIQASPVFVKGITDLRNGFNDASRMLQEYSVPFYSPRYAGHMCFETSMPAILGYLMTILHNPNNVAFEASPITTLMELAVGAEMCRMLGYETDATAPDTAWGHIACDGTVANLESIWAARNLKFYPLSLREAMKPGRQLAFISNSFKVHPCASPDEEVLFSSLETWDLLNLRVKEILDIPSRLHQNYGISASFLQKAMHPYLVQSTGKDALEKAWKIERPAQYLITSTKHYSWPKGAAIAGIGSDNMVDVPVDHKAHLSVGHLEKALEERLANHQAVYAVVAVIGSTEEGAVDPLTGILEMRDKFEKKGLSFVVHADAAWGGYFASMLRDAPKPEDNGKTEDNLQFQPSMMLRRETHQQFEALQYCDSITIDPHKSGYVPYPAGGLCYKDGRMRFLLTWSAPYLSQGQKGESIGIYGVEGSKPGAPAAAVYLHHNVVGLHKGGHGMLLGEVSFTCARFAAHWATMSTDKTPYIVVPFNRLSNEDDTNYSVEEEKQFIRKYILPASNEQLVRNRLAMKELRAIGSDLNINAFACNFRVGQKVNEDVEEANYLNSRVFQALSINTPDEKAIEIPMFLSATTLGLKDYGDCCTDFKRRLGLEMVSGQDLFILRNVVMSPFQSAGNFVKEVADIFETTLAAETKVLVERNTISPKKLTFVLQGTDKIFLVFLPRFHHITGRRQIILSASINGPHDLESYKKAKLKNPTKCYYLQTKSGELMDTLLASTTKNFTAKIVGKDLDLSLVKVTIHGIIKDRTLVSRYRDPDYPCNTPFYLYGTPRQQHIDHMLLRAPNAHLSSDQVRLELDFQLTAEQLSEGLIALVAFHEASVQPINETNKPHFFEPGARFGVTIYRDKHAVSAQGPGLAAVDPADKVASGFITLGQCVWIEYDKLNAQTFDDKDPYYMAGATSRSMNDHTKKEWMSMMHERLGLDYGL